MNKRQQSFLQRKQINNYLPKFALGATPIDRGYQQATNDEVYFGVDQPAADISTLAKGLNTENWQTGLAKGTDLIRNFGDEFKTGISNIFRKSSTDTLKSPVLNYTPNNSLDIAIETMATENGITPLENTTKVATSGSKIASTASKVLPWAQIALGSYNLYNDILDLKNSQMTYKDIKDNAAMSTGSYGGVTYKQMGGYNADALKKYVDYLNTGSTVNMALDGAGVGAGVGSLILPGVGTLIGGLGGALLGGIGSLFGNHDRRDALKKAQYNYALASTGFNRQQESEAMSKAMRADDGKSPTYTVNGETNMPENALVGKGETLYDPKSGNATVVDRGTKRIDNQQAFLRPQDAVLGNLMDPIVGQTYADQARPYAEHLEYLNKISNSAGDVNTQSVQQREINKAKQNDIENLNMITDRQKLHHSLLANYNNAYKCGKSPKYDLGSSVAVAPGLLEMITGIKQSQSYAKDPIKAFNSYVLNPYASKALNVLGNLRYDPYSLYQNLNDEARKTTYAINQSPYTAGQRMGMLSALYGNKMNTLANIDAQAQEINNKYVAAYADALSKLGESEVTRRQQADAVYYDAIAKAEAAKRRGIEMGWQTGLKGANTAAGNWLNNYWTNQNINLWRDQQAIDMAKINMPKRNCGKSPKYKCGKSPKH